MPVVDSDHTIAWDAFGASSLTPSLESAALVLRLEAHISGKLNWVGIGPRNYATSPRGPILTFDHFRHFGTHGPSMQEIAPELYKRVYGGRVRYMIVELTAYEGELSRILAYAESSPRTRSRGKFRGVRPLCNTVPQCLPVCRRRHRS